MPRQTIALLSAVILGLGFYAALVGLRGELGVAVWANDAALTIAYALLVVTAVLAFAEGRPGPSRLAGWSAVAVFAAVGAAVAAGQSPVTAAVLVALVYGLAATTIGWTVTGPVRGWRGFVAVAAFAVTTICVVGGAWIVGTAPAFAEGFVLLSLFLLGVLTCLAALLGYGLAQTSSDGKSALHPGRVLSLMAGGVLLLGVSGLYMIWAEGDARPLLTGVPDRDAVFSAPAGAPAGPAARPPGAARFGKADIVSMLKAVKRPRILQLGNLALLSGERQWAEAYREALLGEAQADAYAGPAHSIKFGQYEAMVRAMLYLELRGRWPDVFSPADQERISAWLDRVLARTLTVEWVDLLYAIPFRDLPEGPYLNQEVGAGALSVLQHLVDDPELLAQARSYLARKAVGWRGNFRNLDDALEYQAIWIANAYAMWRYADDLDLAKAPGAALSIDWLKTQSLLPAVPLNYGLIGPHRPLDALSIAAFALRDGEARWLLDQHLAALHEAGRALPASLAWLWLWDDSVPASPLRQSSVLIAAPTGYNFRPRAMAPDKLVLRGGGEPDLFALFGLRNRGWHRYPATGTVIALFSAGEPVVAESVVNRRHGWLPGGRAKHRDKKIDRLSLSGPMVARSGLDAWVGGITGVYSRWSQATPAFASVQRFVAAGTLQIARMDMGEWSGVEVTRTVVLDGNRWLAVWDELSGHHGLERAVSWNLVGFEPTADAGVFAQQRAAGATVTFLPDAGARLRSAPIRLFAPPAWPAAVPDDRVLISSRSGLRTAAMFRFDGGAPVSGQMTDTVGVLELDEREALVFAAAREWQWDGIDTDASVLHRVETRAGLRYRLFGASRLALSVQGQCLRRLRTRAPDADRWVAESIAVGDGFSGHLELAPGSDADLTLAACDDAGSP